MAYQAIGLGSTADDGTGDTLRVGGDKANDNFVELYTLLGTGTELSSGISASATVVTLAAPTITGVVGGTQTSATITTLATTTVNATTLNGAIGTAAQTNITSLGTLTALVVDDVSINGKVMVMTGDTDDTVTFTTAANGTLSIVTVDDAAAAANIQITADGTVDIDSAGVLTLDSGAAINIEPASGSAILLDGTISVDAGVVTGATSITSTSFVGALTTAAQTNITSLGTLTALVVDDISLNGKVVVMTGDTDDTVTFTTAANGTLSIVTVDTAGAAGNIQVTADGTVDIDSAGVLTLDSGAAINIEPAAGSSILLDGTISIDAGVVTGATSITSDSFNLPITLNGTDGSSTDAGDNITLNGTDGSSTNANDRIVYEDATRTHYGPEIYKKGGDISSASPLVIDVDGDYFDVTGTTSFAAMTVEADRQFTLQFDGALTMTHHATNIDLPGEANITTAAGDVGVFQSTGANTVQCISFTKASGTAVVAPAGGLTLASPQDTTSGTSFNFADIPAGTTMIVVHIGGVSGSGSDSRLFQIQLGDSGGVETAGYQSQVMKVDNTTLSRTEVAGDSIQMSTSSEIANTHHGNAIITLANADTYSWTWQAHMGSSANHTYWSAGTKSLSAELTQLTFLTTHGGVDAGFVNISYM